MFDICCSICGKEVEPINYYVWVGELQSAVHVKLLSISPENEEHDFCKSCRSEILAKAIEAMKK